MVAEQEVLDLMMSSWSLIQNVLGAAKMLQLYIDLAEMELKVLAPLLGGGG